MAAEQGMLVVENTVIPPMERELRDGLRLELDRDITRLNEALADGWHVTRFDYVALIDEGGFTLMVHMER